MQKHTGRQIAGLFLLLVVVLWLPRAFELDRFVTVDEPRWLMRSANFYQALSRGDFELTFQREHPGVTITWAGTAAFLWRFPGYIKLVDRQWTNPISLDRFLENNKHPSLDMLVTARSFVVLAISFTLALACIYAIPLVGLFPAVLGFLLLALDPFMIALARVLHLDGLVSALMLLSLLAFMRYRYAGRRRSDLILSGTIAGLGWLTKSPALFLAPFAALLIGFDLFQSWRIRRRLTGNEVWVALGPFMIWLAIAAFVFVLLWPAMWVDPLSVLKRVLLQAADYSIEGNTLPSFFNGTIYPGGESAWYFYPVSFLWRATPIGLIGLGLTLGVLIYKARFSGSNEKNHPVLILLLFAILYTFFISLSDKKFDRYLAPAQVVLDLVAAFGWIMVLEGCARRLAVRWTALKMRTGVALACGSILGLQLLGVFQTFPYYFNYYNPLLGGGRAAGQVMMIGWGEGMDQAAGYLNGISGIQKMRVASWCADGCFSYFFAGNATPVEEGTTLAEILKSRYAVFYIHQWQRQIPHVEVLDYFRQLTPEVIIKIGDLEYIRIYNLQNAGESLSRQFAGH